MSGNGRRLDIGIASYGKPEALKRTVEAIQRLSVTDWRLVIFDNPKPNVDMRELICGMADRDKRIHFCFPGENIGYAGAVNFIVQKSETEYTAYVDDDCTICTEGWDEQMCSLLDRFHEVGMVFPNGGAYPIDRGNYTEILWAAGFCWMATRLCVADLQIADDEFFDTSLGHQEEADAAQRVRMAGYRVAAIPSIVAQHAATATNDPNSIERINRGVTRWVDKWNRYFNGKNFNYHSPNVTRFEDWPPNALYLEEWWKTKLPGLNDNPEVRKVDGRDYDLIRVPRFKDFYRNRVI